MTTITITNQKGGVGKTTTAHVLSVGLARKGYKVLAVDMDPQTNLTFTAGLDPLEEGGNVYGVMTGEISASQAIRETTAGFHLLPGSLNLAGADMEFTKAGREYILKEALTPVLARYDFCIIDTPPTLGALTMNALTASHRVIVPMCADVYSLQGLSQLQGLIDNVRKYCNPGLRIDGLLLTKYNPRGIINRQLRESLEEVAEQLGTRVYETTIREAVAVREAQLLQSDIFTVQPKSNVTRDYATFIDEFLKGIQA